MSFAHDIAGGNGNLVVTSLKSPNFIHGSQGWEINRDGSAEFHDIIIPAGSGGTVVTFSGTAPVGPNVGDVWYDTSNDLEVSTWSGSAWVPYQIGTNAVANSAITSAQIANATITGTDIAAATIAGSNIANATITGTQIANATIHGAQLVSGTISATQIDNATITGAKIASATITGSNIGSATITGTNLVNNTITTSQIAPATITAGNIQSATITDTQIAGGTITGSNIAPATIAASNIANATITDVQISNGTITTTQISNSANITGTQIASGTVAGSNLVAGTITASEIASGTITGGLIAASTIDGSNINSGTITAGNIQSGTITASQIAANTITASQIDAGTITATQIASGSLTNGVMATWAVDGIVDTANAKGLSMIPDPSFSNSNINSARTGDPATVGTWTITGGTAKVTQTLTGNKLQLLSSTLKPIWVNPGEQYYYSYTVVRSGASTNLIGLQFLGTGTQFSNVALTSLSGTNTVTGVFTVPSGWTQMNMAFITAGDSGTIDNVTFSNPVFQPASLFSPTITGGTITGAQFIADNTSGEFLGYTGTPATGNMNVSLSPVSGTDSYSNAYEDGVTVYDGTAHTQMHVNATVGAPAIELVTGDSSEAEHGAIYTVVSGSSPSQVIEEWITGPGSTHDNNQAAILLTSAAANGATEAVGELLYFGPTEKTIAYWDAGGVHFNSPGGTTWSPVLGATDVSTNTANSTSLQNLTNIWTVPANDAKVGTSYRLTASGTISMGTSVQVLTFCLNTFSNSTTLLLPIGGAEFLAGTSYWWRAQGEVVFGAVGSTGFFTGGLSVNIGVSGSPQATVAGTAQTAGGFSAYGESASTVNTTISHSIALQAKWGSVTGSPSIGGVSSIFERLGP